MLTPVLAALVVLGLGPPRVQEVRVVAVDDADRPFAFQPTGLTIEAGTTVRWVNNTADVFHTVTSTDSLDRRMANGAFDRSLVSAGDFIERTFERPGTFRYFCQPHSVFMSGTIEIVGRTAPRPRGPVSAWAIAGAVVGIGAAAWVGRSRARFRGAGPGSGVRRMPRSIGLDEHHG